MKLKRNFRNVLAASLVATILFASCAPNSTENTVGTSEETSESNVPALASEYPEFAKHHEVTVTWMESGWTGPVEEMDIIAKEIEKRTNLKLVHEAMTLPTNEDYIQKLNLMVSADEIPKFFFGGSDDYTRDVYKKLGENNKILDLTEIIKDYKNLYNLVEPELNLYKIESGKNYFVPTQNGKGYEVLNEAPHGMTVRTDFLAQLGMDYPKTTDEFYTYLKRCKEEIKVDGEAPIGLVFDEGIGGVHNLYLPFIPIKMGEKATGDLPFDYNNDYKVLNYLYTDSPELIEAAKYVNKLYKEGLIDREAMTIKKAQTNEKIASGKASAGVMPWWDMNTNSDIAKETYPDLEFVVNPTLAKNEEIRKAQERKWTNWIGCWSSLIMRNDVDEETARHILAAMDYLSTRDGQILLQSGIEGETFEFNENNKMVFTDDFKSKTNDLDWNAAAEYGIFYYAQLVFNVPAVADLTETPASLEREDNKKGWDNVKSFRDLYDPNMETPKDYYFVSGPIEREKFAAIVDLKGPFWVKVLKAENDAEIEAVVKEWAETCKKMGIDEIIEERNQIMADIIAKTGN